MDAERSEQYLPVADKAMDPRLESLVSSPHCLLVNSDFEQILCFGPQFPGPGKEKDQLGNLFGPFQLPSTEILRKENEKGRQACGALGFSLFSEPASLETSFLLVRLLLHLHRFLGSSRPHCWEECLGVPPASGLQTTGLDSAGDAGAHDGGQSPFRWRRWLHCLPLPPQRTAPAPWPSCYSRTFWAVLHLKAFALTNPSAGTTLPRPHRATCLAASSYSAFPVHPV